MTQERQSAQGKAALAPKVKKLRTGFTTGACAAAAAKAALSALISGHFPDPVALILPKGQRAAFPLCLTEKKGKTARAGIIKDAGDDPDITHGATIIAAVRAGKRGAGIRFFAGKGVGTITRKGLPLPVNEPAINPAPRRMITAAVAELCAQAGLPADYDITISIPNGEELAQKTWNPRLGIIGGLSILGTTGIVRPYSCSAWIYSIQQSIDVARANAWPHIIAATGSASQDAAEQFYREKGQILPPYAQIDMGDFAGAILKYLRRYPVERLTLAGGFAKFSKLAQGAMDLHSARSQVDKNFLLHLAEKAGWPSRRRKQILTANTAKEILDMCLERGINLGQPVALAAKQQAMKTSGFTADRLDIIITDREGKILAHV